MAELPAGLARWVELGGAGAVIDAVRLRAERGHQTETGVLRVELSDPQRREVARLLGTPWGVSGRHVRLQDLAAALAEHGMTVRGLVEAVDGRPIDDRRVRRARERADAEAEVVEAGECLARAGIPATVADSWLAEHGLPRPGSGELMSLADRVCRVWRQLPGKDGSSVRLAQLAATVLGDAHALDADGTSGRSVARLAAAVHDLERPIRAGRAWRQAWLAVGVRCDGVSSRVLVLNLPLSGSAPAVRICVAAAGEPLWLPLRALSGSLSVPAANPSADHGESASAGIFVCENPTVLEAAADELGPDCPPMVCTAGMPTVTALDLLAALAESGRPISVRADLDDAGFTIVQQVRAVAPEAVPWRWDASTYARAVGAPMDPVARVDPVDPLRALYERHRVPVHEEFILDDLIADLRAIARSTRARPARF